MAEDSNKFRVFIRGIELKENPIQDNGATLLFTRDETVEGLFSESITPLLFQGDGYDKIVEIIKTEGVCTRVDIRIQERICQKAWKNLTIGTVPLTSIIQDFEKKTILANIDEETFQSKIRGNIEQKAFINVGRSRNDIEITPVTPIAFDDFLPSTGAYAGTFRADCYSVIDTFEFLVAFMTDGTVTFRSDYLAVSSIIKVVTCLF